jgi:hypothetical protein
MTITYRDHETPVPLAALTQPSLVRPLGMRRRADHGMGTPMTFHHSKSRNLLFIYRRYPSIKAVVSGFGHITV